MTMQPSDLLSSSEVRALLGNISVKTLGRYREKYWTLGVHFVQPVQKIMYVKPMILDWILNGKHDPAVHQQAAEDWVRQNQSLGQSRSRQKTR
jgi:hypothetical protein